MLRRREQWQFMLMERLSSANGNELIEAISEGIEALQEQALRDLDQTLTLPLRQKLRVLLLTHAITYQTKGHLMHSVHSSNGALLLTTCYLQLPLASANLSCEKRSTSDKGFLRARLTQRKTSCTHCLQIWRRMQIRTAN